jgi:hypothetical protein
VGLGEAQGFAFIFNIQSEGVWGAASPPKVLPLIFEQFLNWNDYTSKIHPVPY